MNPMVTKDLSWKDHIGRAAEFSGSEAGYCRKNSLDPAKYYSAKSRLGLSKKRERKSSKFVRVETREKSVAQSQRLPDAKWVAELIIRLDHHA